MKCTICNFEFELNKDIHYVVRENDITGISNICSHKETQLYDAVDCPNCGCQNLLGERLRPVKVVEVDEPIEDEAEDEEPQDVSNSSPEDYDREDILKKIAEAGE